MRMMIDCTPLHAGGGVQVAIAFLEGLIDHPIEWLAIMPLSMRDLLPQHILTREERIIFIEKRSFIDILRARRLLQKLEASFVPDVVFSIFGPAYFKSKAPQLMGFALPNLIYPPLEGRSRRMRCQAALLNPIRRAIFRNADHLVVETETVKERLCKSFNISDEMVSIIGNSINPIMQNFPRIEIDRRAICRILVPSAYYLHKNLEIIPYVAEKIAEMDPALNFEFVLTLNRDFAPVNSIFDCADKLGVGNRIRAIGAVPLEVLAELYQASSLVYLPTLREASTAVYPESFYFGRPLVTSDLPFARELCGDAAVYVPPTDPRATAAQILSLVRDTALSRRLIQNGHQILSSKYPRSDVKFTQQISLLHALAEGLSLKMPRNRESK
jgi:glycosyltransferase involved in cell wall biosynthesis